MIEKTILDYLTAHDYDAYMERPARPPEEYVLIEKIGSERTDFITTTTFALQSYASSLLKAAELNDNLKQVMDEADTLTGVSASRLITDGNFTNTAAKQYRYQAQYEVTHKE